MESLKGFFRRWSSLLRRIFGSLSALVLFIFFVSGEKSGSGKELRGSIQNYLISSTSSTFCAGLYEHKGFKSMCDYLIAHPDCAGAGFFNYVFFFYCDCEKQSFLGYITLIIWLIALFYVLGNTASEYFCPSLEKLSGVLRLTATVAGVTLLPLGNGASDVFASVAAFVGSGDSGVGLNGVLGGALFIACVVAGTISLLVAGHEIPISKSCFLRDLGFLLFTLLSIFVILMIGEINIWGAIAYISIYLIYAFFIAASEICKKKHAQLEMNSGESIYISLIEPGAENYDSLDLEKDEDARNPLWGWKEADDPATDRTGFTCSDLCALLEFPLVLPRKLTIPTVEEDKWSKAYAVASALLAPMLLAFLWNTQDDVTPSKASIAYLVGAFVGALLSFLAAIYTSADNPPRQCLLPWALGGFVMSIVWFYMAANELVALLVALGVIFEINPSILGLTVLAWGNSVGDLMSNVALAMNGPTGLQIAMSGCYAGPMFNALAGLGVSLLLKAWARKPGSYIVPRDKSLYVTIGFLVLGLLWSLVVLPCNKMRPGKVLGVGLIIIYLAFLSLRVSIEMGAFRCSLGVI
ncbi:hypothetical protein NMG60_11005612 [Bertholletia excelsa]